MNPKILISYVYYEKQNTKKNLEFFLEYGLKDHMTMIINVKSAEINIDVSQYKNVILYLSENTGFDFGGHRDNLSKVNFNNYNYFVLMNDICMGPFYKEGNWYDQFIEKLNDETNIVGTLGLGPIKVKGKGSLRCLGSWFLFVHKDFIYDLHSMLKVYAPTAGGMKGFSQVCLIEKKCINNLLKKHKKRHACLVKGNWKVPHNPFDVVFVKENRIGYPKACELSSSRGALCYITQETLNNSINYMNNENRNK